MVQGQDYKECNFPIKLFQFLMGHQRCVRSDVVVIEEDDAFPIDQFWSLSLDCLA